MKTEAFFFFIAFISYFLSTSLLLPGIVFKLPRTRKSGDFLVYAGFIFHTLALVSRIVVSKHLPGYNSYEYISLFSWATILSYLLIARFRPKARFIGAAVIPLSFLFIGYASVLPKGLEPLVPMLRSHWLVVHITSTALAYGAFAVSMATSVMYLIRSRRVEYEILTDLEEIISGSTIIGFIFLTVGISSGAIWAQHVWNRAWGWDPKETASLITWLVYAAFLHTRYTAKWKGRRAAILSITGFLCVLFTFLGIDFFIPREHSFLLR